VVQRHAVRGEAVQATTPLFAVADTSTVWLWIDVYEADMDRVTGEFIEAARRLLLDQEFSRAEGAVLYERNVQHWAKGIPQAAVEEWLQ